MSDKKKTDEIKLVDAEKAELKVNYCIPNWLREEQMRNSCARFSSRLTPSAELRKEPIAIVCFGPSLNDTWEEIKKFKYILTCSGSHGYLRRKGLTPTWHMEVDPRAHKIELIGDDISPETEFLMASCVNPKVFDHLEKSQAKLTLWHTYSGEPAATMPLVYPRGEWVSTGGANVGLRAFVIARMLGFTDLHVFGMDGSFPPEVGGLKHASHHPNVAKKYILAEYKGKKYATTTAFLECARGTFHELKILTDVNVKFYGEGLIQEMAKDKLPELKKKEKADIAFFLAPTISAEYVEQNKKLHETTPTYGVSAVRHVEAIKKMYTAVKATSLLDYGCGKGLLAKNLDFPIWEYDPAIEGKDKAPRPADLVVCIDVLEHIEPQFIDATLVDISRCIKKVGYFVINMEPSIKTLPDGRNTHLLQKDKVWWREKLTKYFEVPERGFMIKKGELHVVVTPKHGAKTYRQSFSLKEDKCPSSVT